MINREKTKARYNYYPEELPKFSKKKVIWCCDKCKKDYLFTNSYALKKETESIKDNSDSICSNCARAQRKGQKIDVSNKKLKAVKLPPEVDVLRTFEELGIDVSKLAPWSRDKIYLKCGCGKSCKVSRMDLNKSKSIQKNGHYKCSSCSAREYQLSKNKTESIILKVSGDNFESVKEKSAEILPFKRK